MAAEPNPPVVVLDCDASFDGHPPALLTGAEHRSLLAILLDTILRAGHKTEVYLVVNEPRVRAHLERGERLPDRVHLVTGVSAELAARAHRLGFDRVYDLRTVRRAARGRGLLQVPYLRKITDPVQMLAARDAFVRHNYWTPISRWTTVPLGDLLVDLLARTSLTPNAVTLTSVLFGLVAALDFAQGDQLGNLLGALALLLSNLCDYVDGQLARRSQRFSRTGDLLDKMSDKVVLMLSVLGIVWGAQKQWSPYAFVPGLLVASGAYLCSASAAVLGRIFATDRQFGPITSLPLRLRRRWFESIKLYLRVWEVLLYVIILAAVVNRPAWALVYLAGYYNLRWLSWVLHALRRYRSESRSAGLDALAAHTLATGGSASERSDSSMVDD